MLLVGFINLRPEVVDQRAVRAAILKPAVFAPIDLDQLAKVFAADARLMKLVPLLAREPQNFLTSTCATSPRGRSGRAIPGASHSQSSARNPNISQIYRQLPSAGCAAPPNDWRAVRRHGGEDRAPSSADRSTSRCAWRRVTPITSARRSSRSLISTQPMPDSHAQRRGEV